MRKILKYFAVVIALTMLLSIKVSAADYKCEYSDGKLTAKFTIDTKNKKASRVTLKGVLKTSDDGLFENDGKRNVDETESVINWEKDYEGIRAIGVHYYKNNNDCPPYGFLVDRQHGLEFAVFSESHKSEFEKLGKSKQGYAIMKLTSSSKKETDDGSDTKYEAGSCLEYTTKNSCESNEYFACIWNETKYGNYCNTDTLLYVQCGDSFDIPYQAPEVISFVVNFLKIATPIILVITSMISLIKALTNSNEDEMKKAQKSLIRKIIAAVMVFFVISIVQFVILKVADTESKNGVSEADNLSTCLSCFLNNDCANSIYSKTAVGGTYICKYVNGSKKTFECNK